MSVLDHLEVEEMNFKLPTFSGLSSSMCYTMCFSFSVLSHGKKEANSLDMDFSRKQPKQHCEFKQKWHLLKRILGVSMALQGTYRAGLGHTSAMIDELMLLSMGTGWCYKKTAA